MKYLVIGVGGVGGPVAGYLYRGGKDVRLAVHGGTYDAVMEHGFIFESGTAGCVIPADRVYSPEERGWVPDVIIVCVKSYSLESTLEVIRNAAGPETVVLPLLNGMGIGDRLEEMLPGLHVLRGGIYVSAHVSAPGAVTQDTKLMKIVFGEKDGPAGEKLMTMAKEFHGAGMDVVLSAEVKKDLFRKYASISPMAAACVYYDCGAAGLAETDERRAFFTELTRELVALGEARGVAEDGLFDDMLRAFEGSVKHNVTPSFYRDVKNGRQCETDSFLLEPISMAKEKGLDMANYRAVAEKMGLLNK